MDLWLQEYILVLSWLLCAARHAHLQVGDFITDRLTYRLSVRFPDF